MSNHQVVRGVMAYTKAANMDPFSVEAISKLGDSLMKEGDFEGAAQTLETLVILTQDETTALLRLASVYAGLSRYCDALSMLQKARDKETDPARAASLDTSIRKVSESCRSARPAPHP
jgi:tetratricopeptide (TPR) repeat protein